MSGEGTFSVAQELDAEVPLVMKIAGIGEADTDSVQYMRQHDARQAVNSSLPIATGTRLIQLLLLACLLTL